MPYIATFILVILSLGFSLNIRAQTSPVPCKSLYQAPATSTPAAVWTVIRLPSDLSRMVKNTRFWLHLCINDAYSIVHFHSASRHALDWFISLFLLRSIPQLLSAAPTGSLKPAPECRFREAFSHLLQSMIWLRPSFPLSSQSIFRTHVYAY